MLPKFNDDRFKFQDFQRNWTKVIWTHFHLNCLDEFFSSRTEKN